MVAARKQQLAADRAELDAREQELRLRQEAVRDAEREVTSLKRKLDALWNQSTKCGLCFVHLLQMVPSALFTRRCSDQPPCGLALPTRFDIAVR